MAMFNQSVGYDNAVGFHQYGSESHYNTPNQSFQVPTHHNSSPSSAVEYMVPTGPNSDATPTEMAGVQHTSPSPFYPNYGSHYDQTASYNANYQSYSYRENKPLEQISVAPDKVKVEPSNISPDILDLDSQKVLGNQQNGVAQPAPSFETVNQSYAHRNGSYPPPQYNSIINTNNNIPPHRPHAFHPYMTGALSKRFGSSDLPQASAAMMGLPSPTLTAMNGTSYAKPDKPLRINSKTGKDTPSNAKREKSFKCEVCNKWFTSAGHLKRHYTTAVHQNAEREQAKGANSPAQMMNSTLRPNNLDSDESSNNSPRVDESGALSEASNSPMPMRQHASISPQPSHGLPPPPQYQPPQAATSGPRYSMAPPIDQGISYSQLPYTSPSMLYQGNVTAQQYCNTPMLPMPTVDSTNPANSYYDNNNMFGYTNGSVGTRPVLSDTPVSSAADALISCKIENEDSQSYTTEQRESVSPTGNSLSSPGSTESLEASEHKYGCSDCSKQFSRMCYLTQHRSSSHDGEKPFKCPVCGKKYATELTFEEHQKKHTGRKPFQCDICPKEFNHKTDLRRHMCLHTGEKPYVCDQCQKGFIRKDHMMKHKQTHTKKPPGVSSAGSSKSSSLGVPSMMPLQMSQSSPSHYPMNYGGSMYMPSSNLPSHNLQQSSMNFPTFQNGIQNASPPLMPTVSLPSSSGGSMHSVSSLSGHMNSMVSPPEPSPHYAQPMGLKSMFMSPPPTEGEA